MNMDVDVYRQQMLNMLLFFFFNFMNLWLEVQCNSGQQQMCFLGRAKPGKINRVGTTLLLMLFYSAELLIYSHQDRASFFVLKMNINM